MDKDTQHAIAYSITSLVFILLFSSVFWIPRVFSHITVKGDNGNKYTTYQECCYANDYEAAHIYLARMKKHADNSFFNSVSDGEFRRKYAEAKKFVLRQEAAYLISTGDQTAKQRVLYLIKEEEARDEMIGELAEIAIDCDDVSFAMTLFDKQKKRDYSLIQKATEHLAKTNDEEQLLDFVRFIPIIGTKPTMGHNTDISTDETNYMKSVRAINNACDVALEYAISHGNKEMAQSVLKLYKSGIDWFWGGDDIKKNNKYYSKSPTGVLVEENKAYIWSDNKSKNEAQTKYSQAIKNHMFN